MATNDRTGAILGLAAFALVALPTAGRVAGFGSSSAVASADEKPPPKKEEKPFERTTDTLTTGISWCQARFLAPLRTFADTSSDNAKWSAAPSDFAKHPSVSMTMKQTSGAGAPSSTTTTFTFVPPAAPTPSSTWDADLRSAIGGLTSEGAPGLRVIIATVPDPVDSGLRCEFDSVTEALQLGVEEGGEVLRDQWWTPWHDPQLADPSYKEATEACRRDVPGVVLFRPSKAGLATALALLLLVGETPTYGVQKRALREALHIADVVATAGAARASHYDIVGPTFSGSAASIKRVLDSKVRPEDKEQPSPMSPTTARIRTGSAMGREVAPILTAQTEGLDVQFERTTIRQDELECAFYRYVARNHFGYTPATLEAEEMRESPRNASAKVLPGVAVLRESGTAFGASNEPDARDTEDGCEFTPEIRLGFPLHVSYVRNAYAESGPVAPGQDALVRRTSLDPTLKLEAEPRDSQGATSLLQTTVAEDSVLSHLLSEVSREGVRYLAIQATDIADAVFLAQKLRDVAPDVRLVFFESDILLLHPAFRHSLLGSFVVSPYPFFGSNDFAGPEVPMDGTPLLQHGHRPFPSQMAEGVFNATISLVVPEDRVPAKLVEYFFYREQDGSPDQTRPLPVWITAIASDGVSALAVRPADDCDGYLFGSKQPPDGSLCEGGLASDRLRRHDEQAVHDLTHLKLDPDVTPPSLWQFFYVAVVVAAFLDWLRKHRHREVIAQLEDFSDDDGASKQRILSEVEYTGYDLLQAGTLWGGFMYMYSVHRLAIGAYARGMASTVATMTMWLGFCALSAATLEMLRAAYTWIRRVRAVWRHSPPDRDVRETTGRVIFAAAVGALGGATAICLVWSDLKTTAGDGVQLAALVPWANEVVKSHVAMFVLRTLPLLNGVTPALPCLVSLLCIYTWAAGHMNRMIELRELASMSEGFRGAGRWQCATPISFVLGDPPATGGPAPRSTGLRESEASLARNLLSPGRELPFLVAFVGLVLFPGLILGLREPTTLESFNGTTFLLVLLLGCAVSVSTTLVQMWMYWFSLHQLLRRIAAHPIGTCFDQVAEGVAETVDAQISHRQDDLRILGCCLSMLAELKARSRPDVLGNAGGQPAPGDIGELWKQRVEREEHSLGASFQWLKRAVCCAKAPPTTSDETQARRSLLQSANAVASDLVSVWSLQPSPPKTAPENASRVLLWVVFGEKPASSKSDASAKPKRPLEADPVTRWLERAAGSDEACLRSAHAFLATVVAMLLGRYVRQFRYFIAFLTIEAVLVLVVVSNYVFEPERLLLTWMWVVMLSVVGMGLFVYLGLQRNRVLSRIGGTEPGRIDLSPTVAIRVLTWGLLPLLTVAAAQYPDLANSLFSWFQPLTKALH